MRGVSTEFTTQRQAACLEFCNKQAVGAVWQSVIVDVVDLAVIDDDAHKQLGELLGKTWIKFGQFICQFVAHSLGFVIGHLPTSMLFLILQLCESLPQFSQGGLQAVAPEGGIIHDFAGILQLRARQGGVEGMGARLFGTV